MTQTYRNISAREIYIEGECIAPGALVASEREAAQLAYFAAEGLLAPVEVAATPPPRVMPAAAHARESAVIVTAIDDDEEAPA